MSMKKRVLHIVLVVCMLLVFTLFASAAERATLYINDTQWENDSILPFIESGGKRLVPASAFAAFGGISVSMSETLGSLLIESGDRYLSFNLNFGSCLDDEGNIFECGIFRYGGQIYLEPHAVCEKFDLAFETAFASDGYLAARLTDGRQTTDFATLLSSYTDDAAKSIPYLYNPTGKTVEGSFVYPILLVPTPVNVATAVKLLGDNRVSFAISPFEILKYSDVLGLIYANGHTVAYYLDAETANGDISAFEQQMDRANKYLFSLLGKTTRIYVSTEKYADIPAIDGYFAKSCRLHLVADDLVSERMITSALITSPAGGSYNFSLASDRGTRSHYSHFFNKLNSYKIIHSMPLTESSSVK